MSRLVKILLGLAAVVVLVALYVLNPRLPAPQGEQSALLYEPGTFDVSRESLELVDTSRGTSRNGEFTGSPTRELNGYIWYPQTREQGPYPLIIYSHGFMSSVSEADYLVDFLVPKGYVVAAIDYPLSHGGAPGGPNVADVINQPADASFVLDQLLARNAKANDSLYGMLDPSRIAAVGLSLGGLTTQLAAYHRDLRDPRFSVAVSIAGPSVFLEPGFFDTSDIPFMMIAGSADAIVPYEDNAAPIPAKTKDGLLVTLDKGTHVGFTSIASVFLRWVQHPDKLVCPMLLGGLDREGSEGETIMTPDRGIGISDAVSQPCVMDPFERAMRPADQLMLTRLALYAFLEQAFAPDSGRRRQMADYLSAGFVAENPAARIN